MFRRYIVLVVSVFLLSSSFGTIKDYSFEYKRFRYLVPVSICYILVIATPFHVVTGQLVPKLVLTLINSYLFFFSTRTRCLLNSYPPSQLVPS